MKKAKSDMKMKDVYLSCYSTCTHISDCNFKKVFLNENDKKICSDDIEIKSCPYFTTDTL